MKDSSIHASMSELLVGECIGLQQFLALNEGRGIKMSSPGPYLHSGHFAAPFPEF